MRTFLRILGYARPVGFYLPQYLLLVVFATIFSVINITVLIPLLEILFDQVDVPADRVLPEFNLSITYFKNLFYYYLNDFVSSNGRISALYFICAVVVTSVLLANLFRYLSQLILARVRVQVIRNLRNDAFHSIAQFDLAYLSDRRKGDIVSRVTTDVLEVEQSAVSTLKVLIKEPFLIIGYFIALFSISAELTLYTLLMIPAAGFAISIIGRRLKHRARNSQESLGRIASTLDEVLSGIRIIKAFSAVNYMRSRFSNDVDQYARHTYRLAAKSNLVSPASELIAVGVIALILLIGGQMVLNSPPQLEASEFIGFLLVYSQILAPAKSFSTAFGNINRGLASGDRIFQLIDNKPAIIEKPDAEPVHVFKHNLVFDEVSFAYHQKPVLKKMSLEIKKGEIVALVGPSGGGKSTLADLIPRFYDPTGGRVLLDGVDLRDYQIEGLRNLIGIVTQEAILFNDSIAGNIAFGKPDATPDEIKSAAIVANAHAFIEKFDGGYNYPIGDRGSKLSGGQRQRITIARAVLKNPPILILDEATSALDSYSEKKVQEALVKLMQNRTTILIAHRLSTIQHAHKIIVIKDGVIIDQGTHSELLERGGLYRGLTELQSF